MTADELAERQRRWAEMEPAQRTARIQTALIGTLDYARWRRQEERRRTTQRLAAQPRQVMRYDPL